MPVTAMACVLKAMLWLKMLTSGLMPMSHASLGLFFPMLQSEEVRWGLYKWCSVKDGNVTECHKIHPGESPAYFEVARFSAAFAVVMMFLSFAIVLWIPADNATCKWRLKLVIMWMPSLNVGTTLGLVAAYYKDDDRWKDSNPSLNSAFYFIAVLAVLDFLPTCFFFIFFACACQRQGRHSCPPPNAEPISNQGEKNQTRCSQRLHSAKVKVSILWKQLCRKLVTAMKRLKASICRKCLSRKPVMTMENLKARSSGKRLSRKLDITMKRLGPGTVQNLPDNSLRHQPGQPEGHGSRPIRHAPGGPAGDLPPGIVHNDASDTSSVRAGHSEGAARYNAADVYRSGGTTIHQTAGQGEVSRYITMDSVILQDAPPEWSGRSAAMDPVIGQGGQEELSHSHSARDAPWVHSICRPQLTPAEIHSFVDPQTSRLIFQLRRPGQTGGDSPSSSYI